MSEKNPYAALATALRQRGAVIADRQFYQRDPAAHLSALERVSENITTLQGKLPRPVPAPLAHFLERCSYDKALVFLDEMPLSATS